MVEDDKVDELSRVCGGGVLVLRFHCWANLAQVKMILTSLELFISMKPPCICGPLLAEPLLCGTWLSLVRGFFQLLRNFNKVDP
jgi:hypothetical protein